MRYETEIFSIVFSWELPLYSFSRLLSKSAEITLGEEVGLLGFSLAQQIYSLNED